MDAKSSRDVIGLFMVGRRAFGRLCKSKEIGRSISINDKLRSFSFTQSEFSRKFFDVAFDAFTILRFEQNVDKLPN